MLGKLVLLSAALLSTPAVAFELDGLAIDPPEGYAAEAMTGAAATIGILPPSDGPAVTGLLDGYLCELAFDAYASDSVLRTKSQEWHNTEAREPEAASEILADRFGVKRLLSEGSTLVGGVAWLELAGIPQEDAGSVVAVWSTQTPGGSTMLLCAVSADAFATALPALRAIRSAVAPPR